MSVLIGEWGIMGNILRWGVAYLGAILETGNSDLYLDNGSRMFFALSSSLLLGSVAYFP